MAGISFQESFDDLDEGYFAVLEFAASFGVMLRDYARAPVKGSAGRIGRRGCRSRRSPGIYEREFETIEAVRKLADQSYHGQLVCQQIFGTVPLTRHRTQCALRVRRLAT